MDIKIDHLLAFCSYYTLVKTNLKLSHFQQPPKSQLTADSKPKTSKNIRKKFEGAEPKKAEKTIKPKLQHTSKTPRKQISPIHREDLKDLQEDCSRGYDIKHFVNHLTAKHNDYAPASKIKQQETWNHSQKKNQSNLQNYQTFGRSRTKTMDYQTFQEKMQKDRNPYTDRYQRPEPSLSQFISRTEIKPVEAFLGTQPWWNSQAPKRTISTFIDHSPKQSYFAAPTFENIALFQPTPARTAYSPINRQYPPSNSRIGNSSDSQISTSRTKHQRKKSERPFYDASKLTIKKEEESWPRKQENILSLTKDKQSSQFVKENRIADQRHLSQSYLSVEEAQAYPQPRHNLVQVAHDSKRETSTTAPPPAIHREFRIDPPIHRETDLDDELGQTLTELSNRKAPVAFELRMNS